MRVVGRIAWLYLLAAGLGMAAGEGAAPVQTILVHDLAAVPPEILDHAKAEVERIFSRTDTRIAWLFCTGVTGGDPDRGQPCPDARPAGTIILRIVPAGLDFLGNSVLGYALMPGPRGLYATVSYSRVQLCAGTRAVDVRVETVLAHAMAHEIGHMLLGTNAHANTGLMQSEWGRRVLAAAARGGLNFSTPEARRIHDAVAQRVRMQTREPLALAGVRRGR